jgi:hypothetical protein
MIRPISCVILTEFHGPRDSTHGTGLLPFGNYSGNFYTAVFRFTIPEDIGHRLKNMRGAFYFDTVQHSATRSITPITYCAIAHDKNT